MDEALFLFALFAGFFLLCSIIYCFLSTCLGIQIRRSDLVEAFSLPTPAKIRARDAERQRRREAGGFEMDNPGYERVPPGAGVEEFDMLRRTGGRGFY